MRSQRVVVAFGERNRKLWDAVYDAFGGKVAREKIDGFAAGAGTIPYFTDDATVKAAQEHLPRYAQNFPIWARRSLGMLQISIWAVLRELGIGANLQHYNPVIDEAVREPFGAPESLTLWAQTPFGGIAAEPDPKDREDMDARVKALA